MQWSITVTILYGFALLNSGHGSELSKICCHYYVTKWQASWNLLSDLNCNFSMIAVVTVSECIWLLASFFHFYVFQFKCFEGCKACRHFSLFLYETFLDLTSADTDILCKNEIKHKYSGEHLKDENPCNSLIGEPNCFIIKVLKDNTTCKDDLIIIVISQKLWVSCHSCSSYFQKWFFAAHILWD